MTAEQYAEVLRYFESITRELVVLAIIGIAAFLGIAILAAWSVQRVIDRVDRMNRPVVQLLVEIVKLLKEETTGGKSDPL